MQGLAAGCIPGWGILGILAPSTPQLVIWFMGSFKGEEAQVCLLRDSFEPGPMFIALHVTPYLVLILSLFYRRGTEMGERGSESFRSSFEALGQESESPFDHHSLLFFLPP